MNDEMAVVGFSQYHVSAPQVACTQRAQRNAAAALEKGQHTLPQYTDGDLASCEQLVAGLREEQAVGDGAFHRLPSVVSNESRTAAASGRHSS